MLIPFMGLEKAPDFVQESFNFRLIFFSLLYNLIAEGIIFFSLVTSFSSGDIFWVSFWAIFLVLVVFHLAHTAPGPFN